VTILAAPAVAISVDDAAVPVHRHRLHRKDELMRPILLALVAATLFSACVRGDDETPAEPDNSRLEYLVQRLQTQSVTEVNGERRAAELQTSPLMTWQNPISGANGGVFVWTLAGRPVAVTKSHVNDRKQHYVETSITLRDDLQCTQAGSAIWVPEDSTSVVVPVTGLAPPRETRAGRLLQMRELAGSFEIEDQWGEDQEELYQLRLLPRPLFRYEAPAEHVIDGAIFGYSQGTNPEAVVVIEAVETDSAREWRCQVSRLTGYAVTARRNGDVVLEVPKLSNTTQTASFRHVYERPVPYPFVADE
jgi:hypothetical protein